MREITAGELSKILKEHKRWLENEDEGEKANLRGANLIHVGVNQDQDKNAICNQLLFAYDRFLSRKI